MKERLKIILLLPFFLFLGSGQHVVVNKNIDNPRIKKKLEVGEELVYVVKYSVMRLGEIKLKITDVKKNNGKVYYSATADIDSYPSVPFVDVHQIYKTTMTPDYYSQYFKGIIKHSDYTSYSEYKFNYDSLDVKIKEGKVNDSSSIIDTTVKVDKKYQDGLSIFYYARMNSGQDKKEEIPTFMNEKKATTDISFDDHDEDVSIDAVDYDIDCAILKVKHIL